MQDLATALALAMVIEGVLYALFPEPMRRALATVLKQPAGALRLGGLGAVCLGFAWVWLLRH
ncbi:MAG TPA: DUF2065 domain-containing protein [Stellaceae bacterium]|nr:DUF2065 domain-containing protein [Stellaceae bacterium]